MARQEVVVRSMTGAAFSDFLALMFGAMIVISLSALLLGLAGLYWVFLVARKVVQSLHIGYAKHKKKPIPVYKNKPWLRNKLAGKKK